MAGSVNKVILSAIWRDPEVRSFSNGGKVVNLSVATSDRWRDKATNEQRERTEWHRVSIFNDRLGDIAERYLRKGSSVYLEGQLETRKWQDQQGQDRYTTEVVLRAYRGATSCWAAVMRAAAIPQATAADQAMATMAAMMLGASRPMAKTIQGRRAPRFG